MDSKPATVWRAAPAPEHAAIDPADKGGHGVGVPARRSRRRGGPASRARGTAAAHSETRPAAASQFGALHWRRKAPCSTPLTTIRHGEGRRTGATASVARRRRKPLNTPAVLGLRSSELSATRASRYGNTMAPYGLYSKDQVLGITRYNLLGQAWVFGAPLGVR